MSLYDSQGRITRSGAESVIRAGGSVTIGGRVYATVESLPNDLGILSAHREALLKQLAGAEEVYNNARDGEWVTFNGKKYRKGTDKLPTADSLADYDSEAQASARAKLKAQRADIDRQLAEGGEVEEVKPVPADVALRKAHADAAETANKKKFATASA